MANKDQTVRGEGNVDAEAETLLSNSREPASPHRPSEADPDAEVDSDAATLVVGREPTPTGPPAAEIDEAKTDFDAQGRTWLPAQPRTGRIEIGAVIFGEYEIVEVLGAGGMGDVYKAWHRRLEEARAIKMMHDNLSDMEGASELFLREAKALLAVRHPAVVHCHDLLSDDQGRVFLIMELINGVSLSDRMWDAPLPADEVLTLGARLASGLAAAHRCGVVHRDVSPDNVMLQGGEVGQAKLVDFGIAKLMGKGKGTIMDGFKGKLSYASPEQLGFFGGQIDGRSDFYSLGLVLCAAALGRAMNMGTTVAEAVDARRHLADVPEEIPLELRSALEPLLALNPDDRPNNAEQLFVVRSQDRALEEKAPAPLELRRVVPVAAGLALLMGIGAYSIFGGREEATSQPASTATETTLPKLTTVYPEKKLAPTEKDRVLTTKRISALEKVRIVGLLRGAEVALKENRLQLPKGDNAYEKYQDVLRIDPDNREAKRGLLKVASRYLALSEQALERGDVQKAVGYLSQASSVAPHHPRFESVRARVNHAAEG